jgi:tetratricopeptide (TPR) repeat protein
MVEEGRYDQAIDLFYEQIKINPQSAAAWRELGVAFYEKGDLTKAEDALKQANLIRPDARGNLYMGFIYEKQKEYGKAIDAYRTSLSLDPGSKTKDIVQSHLDGLRIRVINQEVSDALSGETAIDVDTIPQNTIAVFDFDNSHLSPEMAPISKGLAELTAVDLGKVKALRVVDRMKIDAILNEIKLSSSDYADPSTAPRMGRLLGSNRIVAGTVLGIGDETIQLDGAVVDTRDSSTTMTGASEGELKRFFDVQKDFVFKIIDSLGISLSAEERDAIRKVPTESYLAFMAYCRGLDYRSQGMYDAARMQFQEAVNEDNGFEQAAKQQQVMAAAPAAKGDEGTFQQFESQSTKASEDETTGGELGSFQSSVLNNQGFIRDPNGSGNYGGSPDWHIRTSEGPGTVIIQGDLDAKP